MHDTPPTPVVVVISADIEWHAVKRIMGNPREQSAPLGKWFEKRIITSVGDHGVVFFHGGWGKIAAAASSQYLVDHCRPQVVLNLGTCGGLSGEIDRGTIVLADRTLVYDLFEQMGDPKEHIAHYTTLLDLSWLAPPFPHPVRKALIVSGDRDIVPEEVPMLKAEYGAVVGDWESAAIAWVCNRNGVRCLILRGVTDLVGEHGGDAYEGNISVYAENTASVMRELVDQLPQWISASLPVSL